MELVPARRAAALIGAAEGAVTSVVASWPEASSDCAELGDVLPKVHWVLLVSLEGERETFVVPPPGDLWWVPRGPGARPELLAGALRAAATVRRRRSAHDVAETLALTPTERRLLWLLDEAEGEVVSLHALEQFAHGARVTRSTVSTLVGHLRAKLAGSGCEIEAVRGVGYRLRRGRPRAAVELVSPEEPHETL